MRPRPFFRLCPSLIPAGALLPPPALHSSSTPDTPSYSHPSLPTSPPVSCATIDLCYRHHYSIVLLFASVSWRVLFRLSRWALWSHASRQTPRSPRRVARPPRAKRGNVLFSLPLSAPRSPGGSAFASFFVSSVVPSLPLPSVVLMCVDRTRCLPTGGAIPLPCPPSLRPLPLHRNGRQCDGLF